MSTSDLSAEAFAVDAGTTPEVVSVPNPESITATPAESKSSKFYTEEDLARVRSQEKNKLYEQISDLKTEVSSLKKAKEDEAAAKQAQLEAEETERATKARTAAEAEMDVRELLRQKEAEFNQQLELERQERERLFATLEREKQYADLQSFKQQTLETERDNIIPELLDLVNGNSREEVAQSIESLKERSARILESAQAAMQNARKEMKGTSVTAPTAGPLDVNSEQRNFTAQEIAAMSQNDYAKYRQRLLSPTAQGRGQGMFGNN